MRRVYARYLINILLHGHLGRKVVCSIFHELFQVFSLHQAEATVLIHKHVLALHTLVLVRVPQMLHVHGWQLTFAPYLWSTRKVRSLDLKLNLPGLVPVEPTLLRLLLQVEVQI